MLTVKQEKFCVEYAKSGNATEAYKKAGYEPKNYNAAGAAAARLLKNVRVQNRLRELQRAASKQDIADAQEIQGLLTKAMRKAAADGDTLALCKTADILNKMHGDYINKTQVSGIDGGPIVFGWQTEVSDDGD